MYGIAKKCISIASLLVCCWVVAESFVVKKKAVPSTAKLKEACCDEFVEQMKLFAYILQSIGEIQETGIVKTSEILEGTKQSFFAQANKMQLQNCLCTMQRCSQQLTHVHDELQEYKKFLRTLKIVKPTLLR